MKVHSRAHELEVGGIWLHHKSTHRPEKRRPTANLYKILEFNSTHVTFESLYDADIYTYTFNKWFSDFDIQKPELDRKVSHIVSMMGFLKEDPESLEKIYNFLVELEV